MKRGSLILGVILWWFGGSCPFSVAQSIRTRPVTLYYDASWDLTTPEKAVFYRETFLDMEEMRFSGVCKDYSKTHKLMGEGFYQHGVNAGLQTEYFENGVVRSTIEFAEDGFIIWDLTNEANDHMVSSGTGKFSIEYYYLVYDNSGARLKQGVLNGEFQKGKRVGTWTYQDKGGVATDEELYEAGTFVSRTAHTNTGTSLVQEKKSIIISLQSLIAETFSFEEDTFTNLNAWFEKYGPAYPENFHRPITFPGGLRKLLLLIASEINLELQENMAAVITVDEHGNLVKMKITPFLLGWQISDEVTRIMQLHKRKLLPAISNGKPYALTMKIPIGSSPEWIDYLQNAPDSDVNALIDELNKKK